MERDTMEFLTGIRDSIESKIENANREGRAAITRVESQISVLSREIGEQTMALNNHKADDDRIQEKLSEDIKAMADEAPGKVHKSIPVIAGGALVALAEWVRSIYHQ